MPDPVVDLTKPRYDQSTYFGRAQHFLEVTNPLNLLASDKDLDEAKQAVSEYKKTRQMPRGYDLERLWKAKYLYDSAFHPDTGEKVILIGRMSAQAPMNTLITGGMITFYKTTAQTVFFQWINQTFNAIVNYSNRSGSKPIDQKTLIMSYCAACGGALSTALYLNSKVKNMNPIFARLVPFAAVCGANFINIPMMRSSEIMNGASCFTPSGEYVGESKNAARFGIFLVCVSRVGMALPGMTITPIIVGILAQKKLFRQKPGLLGPVNLLLVGMCVTFATPLCCALFSQTASYPVDSIEQPLQDQIKKKFPDLKEVQFNKGL